MSSAREVWPHSTDAGGMKRAEINVNAFRKVKFVLYYIFFLLFFFWHNFICTMELVIAFEKLGIMQNILEG